MRKLTLLATLVAAFLFSGINLNAQQWVLYGNTFSGGANGLGTFYSYNTSTNQFAKLADFSTATGGTPQSGVSQDPNNKLFYGLTISGGTYNWGTVYTFDTSSNQLNAVYSFDGVTGKYPYFNSMTFYNGLFYGTSYQGGTHGVGNIFSFNPATNDDSTLVSFNSNQSGSPLYPEDVQLTQLNGVLYGISNSGGVTYNGTIYGYNVATGKDSVYFQFNGTNGSEPTSQYLSYDPANGLLYGTTQQGGTNNDGIIFSFNPSTGQENILFNFTSSAYVPNGSLLYDTASNSFYGLTSLGGANSKGTIFNFNPNTNQFNVLGSFGNALGGSPINLIKGPCGLLFGTTTYGGNAGGGGVLFSFNLSSYQLTPLYSFTGGLDGYGPAGSLTFVQKGGTPNGSFPQTPKITITTTGNTICSGNSTTLTANGANTYSWSNGATTSSISVSPSDTTIYTVIGSNSGCSSNSADTVKVIRVVPVNVTPSAAAINLGAATTLTASGGSNSFTWSPATGLNTTTGATVTANPASTTTYTVSSVGINGCTSTQTVTVYVNSGPILINTPMASVCLGSPVTLTASGGKNYTWNTGHAGANLTVSPTTTTTYTVTGKVGTTTYSAEAVVTINPLPLVYIEYSTPTICPNGSATLVANGANTYIWSPSTGLNSTTADTIIASPTSNTTYTLTGTAVNGCSATQTQRITIGTIPTIKISGKDTICDGSTTTLTASGAGSQGFYIWSTGDVGQSITYPPTNIKPAAGDPVVSVIGTNSNGCSDSASVNITINATPNITITSSSTSICKGNSATLTASGANTYKWNTGSTNDTIIVSPNTSKNYTVKGTGTDGCKASVGDSLLVDSCGPGSICTNPIFASMDGTAGLIHQKLYGTTRWYSFKANSKYLTLIIESFKTDSSTGHIHNAYLYSSCNSLPIDSASLLSDTSTIVSLSDTNIVSGKLYLLKLTRNITSCPGCNSNDTVIFNIYHPSFRTQIHPPAWPPIDGSLNPDVVILNQCGLNYVEAHQVVQTRYPGPLGTGLPTTINITGLPKISPCTGNLVSATLYFTAADFENIPGQPFISPNPTVTITNTAGVSTTYPITYFPYEQPTLWGDHVTIAGKANIIGSITGNGVYTINFKHGYGFSGYDIDGVSIIVIYTDPTANYQGNIEIDDGLLVSDGSTQMNYAMTSCFKNNSICLPGIAGTTKAFTLLGDVQSNSNTNANVETYNNSTVVFPNNFWNYCPVPTTLSSNQASVLYQLYTNDQYNDEDCFTMAVAGLYWQSSCNTTPCPVISVNASPANICVGGSTILTASGGSNYTWSTGATTSSIVVSPTTTTTYTVTGKVPSGCTQSTTVTVTIQNIAITGTEAICDAAVNTNDIYLPSFNSTITGFPCEAPTYQWTIPSGEGITVIGGVLTNPTLTLSIDHINPIVASGFTISLEVCCGSECCTQSYTIAGCCTNGNNIIGIALIDKSTTDLPTSDYSSYLTGGPPYILTNINSTNNNPPIPDILVMDGTFTVNSPLTIDQCDVEIGSLGQIIVQSPNTLTITNSHLHACDNVWNGIIVQPGATLVIDNSLIEDAIDGVTSQDGAKYTISSSDFNKDYVGINVTPFTGIHPGTVSLTHFRCYNDTYTFPGTITLNSTQEVLVGPAPYTHRTSVGVNVANTNSTGNITIGDNSNVNNANVFNNVDCGIQFTGGICQIYNNIFRKILSDPTMNPTHRLSGVYASGTPGITTHVIIGNSPATGKSFANTFTDCLTGVQISSSVNIANVTYNTFNTLALTGANTTINVSLVNNVSCNLQVTYNTMNNPFYGVYASMNLNSKVFVNSNTIIEAPLLASSAGIYLNEATPAKATSYTVLENTISGTSYGIVGSNLSGVYVAYNSVTPNTLGPVNDDEGIWLNDSKLSIVSTNTITATSTAGPVDGIKLEGGTGSNRVICNVVNSTTNGFVFGGANVSTFFADNNMNNNSTGLLLHNSAKMGLQGVIPKINQAATVNGNMWNGTTVATNCISSANGKNSEFVVPNPPNTSAYPTTNISTPAKRSVVFAGENLTQSAYTCGITPPVIAPLALNDALQVINDSVQYTAFPTSSQWMANSSLYQYVNTTGDSLLTYSSVKHFRDSLRQANMGVLDSVNTLLTDTNGVSAADISQAQALLNAVISPNNIEQDLSTVYGIMIAIDTTGTIIPDNSQAVTLRVIAKKCPYNYGPAVWMARALLADVDTNVIYSNKCENMTEDASGHNPDETEQNTTLPMAKVYPNPANESLSIEVVMAKGETDNICFYNSMGEKVRCIELTKTITTMPTTNLAEGIYFYRITNAHGELIKADKQVITH